MKLTDKEKCLKYEQLLHSLTDMRLREFSELEDSLCEGTVAWSIANKNKEKLTEDQLKILFENLTNLSSPYGREAVETWLIEDGEIA